MVQYDLELSAALAAQENKADWSATIRTFLGDTRRLRCKRDANANATDPWATGTEFLNVGSNGALTIQGGNITGFGSLSGTTISTSADISTGACVLRLEGNGHWVQGTLGLATRNSDVSATNDVDFVMTSNYVGSNGVGCTAGLKAPKLLPSGTGPSAPGVDADAPGFVRLEDWSNPAAPVFLDLIPFDTRMDNWVFDDVEVASEMGDVRVTQSTKSATIGGFEFGATLLSMNPIVNSVPGEVLHEVLIGCKPTEANWSNYPAYSGYKDQVTDTFPGPFKASILKKDGVTVLYTHQHHGGAYDGLPVNSPDMAINLADDSKPLGWLFHCGQLLPWRSRKPKLSKFAEKYFAGMEEEVLGPYIMRFKTGFNMAQPYIGGSYNINALGHWFGTPKHPVSADGSHSFTYNDPYIWPMGMEYAPYGAHGNPVTLALGWAYQPGDPGLHDHYTGPGGVRSDRAIIPTTIATYFTDPNYVRPLHNDPIEDMLDNWNLAYFNHPHHYLTDVKTFSSIPHAQIYNSEWSYGGGTYYGAESSYTSGGIAKTVPMFGMGNASGWAVTDKKGRYPWNGSSLDALHNYSCPGWAALLCNDPMFAYSQKLRVHASIMCQLGAVGTQHVWEGMFMTRQHSWRFLHLGMMWKLASNHPLGVPRADVEARIMAEMDGIYNEIVLPAQSPNPSNFLKAFNNLGCWTYVEAQYYDRFTTNPDNTGGLDNTIGLVPDLNGDGTIKEHLVGRLAGTPENPTWISVYDPSKTGSAQQGTKMQVIGVDLENDRLIVKDPVPAALRVPGVLVQHFPTFTRRIGSAGQMFYMGHCLQLWRQIGLFSAMRKKSPKYEAVLKYMIRCLDKFSIDWVLDTNGIPEYYWPVAPAVLDDGTASDVEVCTSWKLHSQTYSIPQGVEDWVTNPDGSNRVERDINQHNRAQWVFIRRDYFPEIPCERENGIEEACAKFRGFYETHNARVAVVKQADPNNGFALRVTDWNYRMSPLGIIKKSKQLGDY